MDGDTRNIMNKWPSVQTAFDFNGWWEDVKPFARNSESLNDRAVAITGPARARAAASN
jgi:hypothetical protein